MDKVNEENDLMKRCSKCDNEKELFEFNFRKDTQKYRNQCRDCIKLINEEYRTLYNDKIKTRNEEYRNSNKNSKRFFDIDYRECNREKIQHFKKNYFQNKKEEVYKKIKMRKDKDIKFGLACNLRKRVLNAFKAQNVRKTNNTFDLLGCRVLF